jgi:hypothetical protein
MANRAVSPRVDFALQPELVTAVNAAAAKQGVARAEWLRRVVTAGCLAEGIDPRELGDAD